MKCCSKAVLLFREIKVLITLCNCSNQVHKIIFSRQNEIKSVIYIADKYQLNIKLNDFSSDLVYWYSEINIWYRSNDDLN